MKLCIYKISIIVLFMIIYIHSVSNAQPSATKPGISIRDLGTVEKSSVRIKKDPLSGNLYIMQNDGDIKLVKFGLDSTISLTTVYQTSDHGLTAPLGMAFGKNGTMYLAGNEISDTNSAYATCVIAKGIPDSNNGNKRVWSFIAKSVEYTYGHVYNHKTNAIAVDPKGKYIYVNNGACTDHGEMREGHREVGLTSIILKLPVDSNNILLLNDRELLRDKGYIMAEGIRNTFDLAYSGNGDLFGVENSDDRDDPDEMNWIKEGNHYGFPWRIGGDVTPQQFPNYDPHSDPLLSPNAWGGGNGMLYTTYSNDPGYPSAPDSIIFTEPVLSSGPDADKFRDTVTGEIKDAGDLGDTIKTFSPHSSPDGIVFDKDSILAGDLKGGAFVDRINSSALLKALGDTGNDLLHVALTKVNDHYTAKVTQIAKGFISPLGIELAGNKLFVMETGLNYNNNSPKLYEITLPKEKTTDIKQIENLPEYFELKQNYPNPFNPVTNFEFQIPQRGLVTLKIYDVLGREAAVIVNSILPSGNYKYRWNADGYPSGIYVYRLMTQDYVSTKKLILLK